jgi:hypothetical protein
MFRSPCQEFFILREHRLNELIEHVLSRFIEEVGVRVQGLVVLAIEARDVPHELLPARACFDHRHGRLLSVRMARRSCSQIREIRDTGGVYRSEIHNHIPPAKARRLRQLLRLAAGT